MKSLKKYPPRLALKFLRWFCKPEYLPDIEGDVIELFYERLEYAGAQKAKFLFFKDVLLLFRPGIIRSPKPYKQLNFSMFKNNFKIAWRSLLRQKAYSLINILGLAVGFSCATLLYLYVNDELSYDQFHSKYERIYKVTSHNDFDGQKENYSTTSLALAPTLMADYPEVQVATRFATISKRLISYQENSFYLENSLFVDTLFFEVFDFELLYGNKETALKKPNAIVLPLKVAQRIFKNPQEALNQVIEVRDKEKYTITGIVADVPSNSHVQFEALFSLSSLGSEDIQFLMNNWGSISFHTYIVLPPSHDSKALESKLPEVYDKYMKTDFERSKWHLDLKLLALKDMHLRNDYTDPLDNNGDTMAYIHVFLTIIFFILLIAAINYINLATARAIERAKEVGIRKVVGAQRLPLMMQFVMESTLIALLAMVLSLGLIELALPWFNQMADKQLSMHYLEGSSTFLGLLATALILGILSGLYPGVVLSAFKPVEVLKGNFSRNRKGNFLRKTLVVVQFSTSIVLIAGTWVAYDQLKYMEAYDLGFEQENVIAMNVNSPRIQDKLAVFKNQLLQNPNIKGIESANETVGDNISNYLFEFESEGGGLESWTINYLEVGYDYLDVMGIQLKEGRNFSPKFATDSLLAVLVNETLVKKLGWSKPLGMKVEIDEDSLGRPTQFAKVVGVIEDFHYFSLHNAIQPMMMVLLTENSGRIFIKISGKNIKQTLAFIQETYESIEQKFPFEYDFLDATFARQYVADQQRNKILLAFAGLTIFIACLGLFGLASYTVSQRMKEIGIRKVLGASIGQILGLLCSEFVKLVIIAGLIACPLAYLFARQWLQEFVYRITINPLIFVFALVLALLVSLITISFKAWRAAWVNPVEVLRDE